MSNYHNQPDRPANAGLPGLWCSLRSHCFSMAHSHHVGPSSPYRNSCFSYLPISWRQSTHSMAADRLTNFFPAMYGSRNTPHPDEQRFERRGTDSPMEADSIDSIFPNFCVTAHTPTASDPYPGVSPLLDASPPLSHRGT
ncbi:hypothetical protein Y032_0633g897 [Ancylostoma ceylanicum]|uniref:Uncharacterized protein n=1 Tax=Ancylostoma ceylanicum TaxID=53326 RepID=A0A016WK94_9BILA|nr:hypothetical protein Y032_0633g897 [Ancylostoma ceylanicum]